ncbi:MAG: hypothetical protein K2Y71_25795 [Xanthobacteraceae bacterium]|nr:hypothetical protein [Xanthobacteraceae bacterium]
MTVPAKTLAAALIAAAIPLVAAPAAATPLSQSLALANPDVGTVEQVQYRWDRGRWIGPAAAGFAAGAIVGGALSSQAYNEGYYAYGAAPSGYYAYGAAPGNAATRRYRGLDENYGNGSAATSPWSAAGCPSDLEDASGYPSWLCR